MTNTGDMQYLSDGMRRRIRSAVYLPVLQRIGFFGWDGVDDLEEKSVKSFFDRVDEDGGGTCSMLSALCVHAGD